MSRPLIGVTTSEVLPENRAESRRSGCRATSPCPGPERANAGAQPPTRPSAVLLALREWLEELVEACASHTVELGCEAELASVAALAGAPGAALQRSRAGGPTPQLGRLMRTLHADFASAGSEPAVVAV